MNWYKEITQLMYKLVDRVIELEQMIKDLEKESKVK